MPRQKLAKAPLTTEEIDKRLLQNDRERQMLIRQKTQKEVAKNVLDYLLAQVSEHELDYKDTVFALFHCIMRDGEILTRNGIDY